MTDYQVKITSLDRDEAERVIRLGEDSFASPLSEAIDLPKMAEKWSRFAKFLVIRDNNSSIAATLVYYENIEGHYIYIPHFVVLKEHRHLGLGHYAINYLIENAGFRYNSIRLEVRKDNANAIRFYEREGFYIIEHRETSYLMNKYINQ